MRSRFRFGLVLGAALGVLWSGEAAASVISYTFTLTGDGSEFVGPNAHHFFGQSFTVTAFGDTSSLVDEPGKGRFVALSTAQLSTQGQDWEGIVPSNAYLAIGEGANTGYGFIGRPFSTTPAIPTFDAFSDPGLAGYDAISSFGPDPISVLWQPDLDIANGPEFILRHVTSASFSAALASPGAAPSDPILPSSSAGGAYLFNSPTSGSWFDPALASGFNYALNSGDFTEVVAPPPSFGFGPLSVVVGGNVVATLTPGGDYLFGPGVASFSLLGISPPVGAADPSAFPTFLKFSGSPSGLSMTALAGVPEPGTWALLLTGLAGLGCSMRSRRRPPIAV